MEFLDSLDLVTPNKKSKRMRSWYLYEQYKSLERSQLDAAQKLKDRSYQDKILHQELSERRARRRLYDQIGICQSECDVQKGFKNDETKTNFSVSTNDYFETFCEFQHDDYLIKESEQDRADIEDQLSQDGSQLHSHYIEDFKSIETMNDEEDSKPNSVLSIDDNTIAYENLPDDDITNELEMAKKNIAENINLQLETVKENIECLEKYTKLYADGNISFDESVLSADALRGDMKNIKKNNGLFIFWSKLVSFAYQMVQLSHGNCYYDYSLQLFTAVLACDILRRGVSRMSLCFTNTLYL